jgi:hypothetical protein
VALAKHPKAKRLVDWKIKVYHAQNGTPNFWKISLTFLDINPIPTTK